MPLTFLGQLKPTMEQQIALQKALLALVREDEAARAKTAEKAPALARGLGAEPGPAISGGPSYRERPPSPLAAGPAAVGHFRPGAGSLEEALRAATPATGKAIDIQGQAWAKREEIVAANQAELDAQADALYSSVQDLAEKDRDFILSKIVGKGKPSGLAAALGAEPGAISPVAVRTDPLMQTMIDKHYIRLDEKGEYSWMLPMKEKKVVNVNTWTDESGWLQQTTTYEDGTSETELLGRPEKEVAPTGLTPSEELGWARYHFDVAKVGDVYVTQEMKAQGPAPTEGVTIVKRPGGKDEKATAEHVAAYWQRVQRGAEYRRVKAEGIKTIEDAKIIYEYDEEAIKNIQRNVPGMVVDGKWSPEVEQAVSELFLKGE